MLRATFVVRRVNNVAKQIHDMLDLFFLFKTCNRSSVWLRDPDLVIECFITCIPKEMGKNKQTNKTAQKVLTSYLKILFVKGRQKFQSYYAQKSFNRGWAPDASQRASWAELTSSLGGWKEQLSSKGPGVPVSGRWSVAQHCVPSGRKANDTPGFSKSTSGILCLVVASQYNKDTKRSKEAACLEKSRLSTDLFSLLLGEKEQ